MTFEEQLLMDLKTEIAARAERARRVRRRLFTGVAVAALAGAAAVALPLLTGSEQPAYAVSENADGTIRVEINEFRDADKLEGDLKKLGVTADVTYLRPGTKCEGTRGRIADGLESMTKGNYQESLSYKAARPRGAGVEISPKYLKDGLTVMMEVTENADQTSGPEKPRALWQFRALVMDGPVQPCVPVEDPTWDDLGGPEGRPPAGS
ncbi:hypothetical protein GCM10022224_070120 [Nonomuraea antimicrobica]|uniref:Uncharacterized protein n=1 Tax=Nonomuraea antimicrobica TaxID=561173 RepID=A0ABP7CQ74_9ACTN